MVQIAKKNLSYAFYLCLFVVALVELFVFQVLHPHITFRWEEIPGFYALYGFVSCALLILVAKALGYWLRKEENYYRRFEEEGAERMIREVRK